jgi:hypothetical protein
LVFLGLGVSAPVWAQGPPGNRTTGVVYERVIEKDGTVSILPSKNATVSIVNRDKNDETNPDGVYYIVVPSDLKTFALVAKKPGYQTTQSRNYENDQDPVKAQRLDLAPIQPSSSNVRDVVDREFEAYTAVASKRIRQLIAADLADMVSKVPVEEASYIEERLARLPGAYQLEGTRDRALIAAFNVRPGMETEFEQGLTQHAEWHQRENKPWTYYAWQVVSSEQTSQYYLGAFGHRWADFDLEEGWDAADAAHVAANVEPYVEGKSLNIYTYLADISRPLSQVDSRPLTLVHFLQLNSGAGDTFTHALQKVHEAVVKTSWPVNYEWYVRRDGEEIPTYILVQPVNNRTYFDLSDESFRAILREAHGQREAQSLLEILGKSINNQHSQILRYRSDLSYIPEGQ